ncbi:MAG TPA: TadE family type IV pilus minor pilin [Actinomycetota bacterium]|nr:TadE family type IV pilus minor pilin [Actinomycetota bacterium]
MRSRRDGRGSATVELAAAIPLLLAVTLAMVGVIVVARDHVLALGAAREGAREAALSGDQARAAAAARAAVPAGRRARVTVSSSPPRLVRVEVVLVTRVPPSPAAITVRAAAVAAVEPGPPPAPAQP